MADEGETPARAGPSTPPAADAPSSRSAGVASQDPEAAASTGVASQDPEAAAGAAPPVTTTPDHPREGEPDWAGKGIELDADGLPRPLKWRPVFMWRALIMGFFFDLAAEVVLQQLGKQILTVFDLFHAAIVGLILGFAAPSIGRAFGVWWANRQLKQARQATQGVGGAP